MEEERAKKQEEARRKAAEEAIKKAQQQRQREQEQEEQERVQRNLELERKLQELRASLKPEQDKETKEREVVLVEETVPEIPINDRDYDHEKMPIVDSDGKRWVKCRFCGSIGPSGEFCDIGYPSPGLGKCNACNRKGVISPEVARLMQKDEKEQKPALIHYCKQCGSRLVKRSGPYGYYWGCSRYPYCRYTTKKLSE